MKQVEETFFSKILSKNTIEVSVEQTSKFSKVS